MQASASAATAATDNRLGLRNGLLNVGPDDFGIVRRDVATRGRLDQVTYLSMGAAHAVLNGPDLQFVNCGSARDAVAQ